ncbi:recombinase family protein [Paenibacillus lignilyticus]|uniref:Recombinase family protein n=1 Tax=Paenibacillus lignilyticus TaxID=1172615 RepID=A0ABS5CJX3_9BACL|nr:recombinase family protein [Paenibacillus lignilyticus]MBP3966115.1 recombinase family protein [Paenibacillus lignilyticus]
MYTAVYARVSTGMQAMEGTSLDGQVELCIKKANELNVAAATIKVYKEEGVSGEDIDRPAMNLLRQDIGAGLISQIIITHPDRLSRDLTDKLFICREFEAKHVQLMFVDTEYKNTPEGQLFFNLISVIAQYELALIKKRTVRGRLKAVEKDKKIMPMRVPPYGYDRIGSSLVINENEARFVKLIYQWYVHDNLTMREIGTRLDEMGAEPKRAESKAWNASSIHRILRSEIYVGKYYYNRRCTQKVKGERTKTGAPKKTYSIRNESDWIVVEVPAIIDDRLFQLAQEQRVKNTKDAGNRKYEFLLRSLLRCGHCGRKWEGTTYSGRINKSTGTREKYKCYRCPNRNPRRFGNSIKPCPTPSIRAELLDDYVWRLAMEVVADPMAYRGRLDKNNESVIDEFVILSDSIQKLLSSKEKQTDKIKMMFKKDLIDEDELELELRSLKAEMTELRQRYASCQEQMRVMMLEALAMKENQLVLDKINRFIASKGESLAFDAKRHIIQSLVDELLIRCEDTTVHITAVGHLDALLSEHGKNEFTSG